ncbi:hypothetical protein [Mesorhizobium sp.]|nr:hypothetical protein [Mesorhizobium sp.]
MNMTISLLERRSIRLLTISGCSKEKGSTVFLDFSESAKAASLV